MDHATPSARSRYAGDFSGRRGFANLLPLPVLCGSLVPTGAAARVREEPPAPDSLPRDTVVSGRDTISFEMQPIEVWVVREKSPRYRPESFALFTQEDLRETDEPSPYTALVPQNTLGFFLSWQGPTLRAKIDAGYADDLFQRNDEEGRLPDYRVANPNLGYRLPRGLGLPPGTGVRFRIENLFDEDYELFRGWPMPGVPVFGGLSYDFPG